MRTHILQVAVILMPIVVSAATIHVPDDQSDIQNGIDSASAGDTVLVGMGMYSGDGNRDLDFHGKDIVLMSEAGLELTAIDCGGSPEESHRAFNFISGESADCRIIGFTIAYGHWEDHGQGGGAVYIDESSPTFEDCVFYKNSTAAHGGAIYVHTRSNSRISGCRFIGNSAAEGGALSYNYWSDGEVSGCEFKDNTAGYGGAMSVYMYSDQLLSDCVFSGNAADWGGGLYTARFTNVNLAGCTFVGNSADSGGSGVFVADYDARATLERCLVAYGLVSLGLETLEHIEVRCCNVVGNAVGDWVGSVEGWADSNGNISANPRMCNWKGGDLHPDGESPCLPANNPCGVLIGALDAGCDPEHRIWYVSPDGSGDAPTIQAAIDFAHHGDTILLLSGTYRGEGNRDLETLGKAIVVTSEAGPDFTIIDCEASDADRHRGFHIHQAEDRQTIIRGLTVRNGYAPLNGPLGPIDKYTPNSLGGAIFFDNASPVVTNCRFEGSLADHAGGGGCCFRNSRPLIDSCEFTSNWSVFGGGLFTRDRSSADVINSRFEFNHGRSRGSGMMIDSASFPSVRNCQFVNNVEASLGVGMYCGAHSGGRIENCLFEGNTGTHGDGGGIYIMAGNPTISHCTIRNNKVRLAGAGICVDANSNCLIEYCVITGNSFYTSGSAPHHGGGLAIIRGGAPRVSHCTIYGHWAIWGANVFVGSGGEDKYPAFENCLIAYASPFGGPSVEIGGGFPTVSNTNIYGSQGEPWPDRILDQFGIKGNISERPLFCDRVGGDFQLRPESPCLPENNESGELIGALGHGCEIEGNTWRINADGSGDARSIQAAIDSCTEGDTVILSDGTYTGRGNYDISFRGKDIVLKSQNGPEKTIIDCLASETTHRRGFLFENYEEGLSVLEGVTVRNGYTGHGGGIFCDYMTSPTIRDCIITENTVTGLGGGIVIQHSSPTFEGCVISHNSASQGGGAYLHQEGYPLFRGCTVVGNEASPFSGGEGAGFYIEGSYASFEECVVAFHPNRSAFFCDPANVVQVSCSNIYGNEGGDWTGCIGGQLGQEGNISEDPLFCDTAAGNYRLIGQSPCAPPYNSCGQLIGAYDVGCVPTDVEDDDSEDGLPTEYALSQNYPNPFNPITTIVYALPERSHVKITIINVLGQEVVTLINEEKLPGEYRTTWSGSNASGQPVATGVYFYRIAAGDYTATKKMLLLK